MKKLIPGGCLMFAGLFMMMGFFASTQPHAFMTDLIGILLFCVLPIVSGAGLIVSHFRGKKRALLEKQRQILIAGEKEVLLIAQRHEGKLSMAQVVSETSLNADDAEKVMNELIVKSIAALRSNDAGQVFYEFLDMIGSEEEAKRRLFEPLKQSTEE